MNAETRISNDQRQAIADGLSRLLADTYTLYLKTQNFHWNVTGPHFHSLHVMFQQHYEEMAFAIDEIAERVRAVGHYPPGSFARFAKLAAVKEQDGVPSAEAMVRELADDQERVIGTARAALPAAQAAGDEATTDLLIERMRTHEKTAWMLRSFSAA